VSSTLAGNSNINAVVVKTSTEESEIVVDGGTANEFELRLDLKNEGSDNLSPAGGALDNFIFTAEFVKKGSSVSIDDFKPASSNNVDAGINVGQIIRVDVETSLLTIPSNECDAEWQLCVCVKPAKNVVPPEQVSAYEDTDSTNDVACMPAACSDGNVVNPGPKTIDIEAFEVTNLNIEPEAATEGGKATKFDMLLTLRNNGDDDLNHAPSNLDNFVFTADLVKKGDTVSVNDFKPAFSNNVDAGVGKFAKKTIDIRTSALTIPKSECETVEYDLCFCVKAAKNVVPPEQVLAYNDPVPSNDVKCVPVRCSGSNIQGDPHIIVYGKSDANPLCFDILGYTGRQFILLNDTVAGWGIYATSLDDKYFHIVVIETRTSHVTIDTRGVPNTGLTWKNGGEAQMGDISLAHDSNSKKIRVETGGQDRKVVFVISLEKHSISAKHLDIQVAEHRILDENVGGLLGHAKRNYVGSQSPVQDMAYGAVKIGDRYFGARLAKRGNTKCWLVSPEEALYPFNSEMFLVPDDEEDMSLSVV